MDFVHDQINKNPSEIWFDTQNKKIEKILILDTETTAWDVNKDEVIFRNQEKLYKIENLVGNNLWLITDSKFLLLH